MPLRSAKLLAVYLLGIAILGGWALGHVAEGALTRENRVLVIVLPLAWILCYWPTLGSLLAAWKLQRLQGVLARHAERARGHLDNADQQQEVEDALLLALMQKNPLPERWARTFVRRALAVARRKAAQDGERTTSPV